MNSEYGEGNISETLKPGNEKKTKREEKKVKPLSLPTTGWLYHFA
jgi:hypothetical protein